MTIGITMGDAAGVGPEILLKAAARGTFGKRTLVVYGDLAALEKAEAVTGSGIRPRLVAGPEDARPGEVNLIDFGMLRGESIPVGEVDRDCGAAALAYVERATRDALSGVIAGYTTLPVNKEACRLTRPGFTGHTGMVAAICGTEEYAMLFASSTMIVSLVSIHVSLREAIESLSVEGIVRAARLTVPVARRLRGRARIAVPGLNPHAGEGGAFGTEDLSIVAPAVEILRREGIDAAGPFPPDTLFRRVVSGEFDAAVCLYHDQGLIPLKLVAFDEAVNITVGLPVVRTSVDHGTAFDIAYRGIADPGNFEAAVAMCEQLAAPEKQ